MFKLAIPLLHVSDPVVVEKFYCGNLGFQKTFAYHPFGASGPCYFGLTRENITIHLSSFPEDSKSGSAVVLIVDDVDALYIEFISKNTLVDLAPTDQSWGNREMYIKDPDENSIRFTQWTEQDS